VCIENGAQGGCGSVSDSVDGEIVTWVDCRNNRQDLYAQRINGSGETLWDSNGVYVATAVETTAGFYTTFQAVTDGKGGTIITWRDHRAGWDIYSQRVDSKSHVRWDSGGLPVCTDPAWQNDIVMVPDGNRGAIIAWADDRRPPDCSFGSIFAQRVVDTDTDWVDPHFDGGRLPRGFSLSQNWPNPFNANTAIGYQLSAVRPLHTTLKVYNILGEEVRTLVNQRQRSGFYRVVWDGKDKGGRGVSSGIYFYQLRVGRFSRTRKMLLLR
jgi:hypothetical protein